MEIITDFKDVKHINETCTAHLIFEHNTEMYVSVPSLILYIYHFITL